MNPKLPPKERLKEINDLIKEINQGNKTAANTLIVEFSPLIYKISAQINSQYNYAFRIQDIIDKAKELIIYITVIEYKPEGKAAYPYFIQKFLYARLVQYFRPLFRDTVRHIQIDSIDIPYMPTIVEEEKQRILELLNAYVDTSFTLREKDILRNYTQNDKLVDVAKRNTISKTRTRFIGKRILLKLKHFLFRIGIKEYQDV